MMRRRLATLVFAGMLLLGSGAMVRASVITIPNYGFQFESNSSEGAAHFTGSPGVLDWTSNSSSTGTGVRSTANVDNGTQTIDAYMTTGNYLQTAAIPSVTLQAGTYTLGIVQVGGGGSSQPSSSDSLVLSLYDTSNSDDEGDVTIPLASVSSNTLRSGTITILPGNGDIGASYAFRVTDSGSSGFYMEVDTATLSGPVPEPTAVGSIGGLLGIAMALRRKRPEPNVIV